MTLTEFVEALNQKFSGIAYSFSIDKPGAKFTRVVRVHTTSRSVYCFVDAEGNIYKSASWKAPAKGVRATLESVDLAKVDPYGSWLYR